MYSGQYQEVEGSREEVCNVQWAVSGGGGEQGGWVQCTVGSIRRWKNLGHDLRAVGLDGVAEEAILCVGKERCVKLCSAAIVSVTHFLCDVTVLGAQSQCPLETPVAHTTQHISHTHHISHTPHLTHTTSLWSYLRVGVTCFCSKASTPPRTSLWKAEREREGERD